MLTTRSLCYVRSLPGTKSSRFLLRESSLLFIVMAVEFDDVVLVFVFLFDFVASWDERWERNLVEGSIYRSEALS